MPNIASSSSSSRRGGLWFWAVAVAFTVVMAFTTAPTPLWSGFAHHDRFSSLTITIVFAVYAVAVALSLFLAGHLSDWYGRRRMVALGLALNVIAAVVFVVWPELPGLFVARIVSGLGVGVVTATATAWLAELDAARRPPRGRGRAQIVAAAANLGGLGLGGLVAGVLAQSAGDPLTLPFLVLGGSMALALIAISFAPETRSSPPARPRYRPQRVSVPAGSRARFFAAGVGAAITFALFGLITSLAPSFLATTLHQPSRALAGAVSFAMFAAAAIAQTMTGARPPQQLLARGIPALLIGIALLTVAVWLPTPSFGLFLVGDLVAGAGGGLMFKGGIGTVSEISLPEHRAEALAGLYLAAYIGLAGPVIGLGALTQIASTRVSLLVFSGLLALGIVAATRTLLGGRGRGPRASAHLHPISS
ncbi:MAG TPA: MFS transporter [Solirubrobacteraceae bacterium]|nr:MFS transporter [Solirubrobacteraceae bacterium]